MNINIVKATINDIDNIDFVETALNKRILSKEAISSDLNNPTKYYYIAKVNDRCVGYIGSSFMIDHFDILSIAVLNDYRKKGVATKLLQKIFEKANIINVKKIFLEVRCSNIPAINFYEKIGFNKISTRKNYYESPSEDAFIYLKELES